MIKISEGTEISYIANVTTLDIEGVEEVLTHDRVHYSHTAKAIYGTYLAYEKIGPNEHKTVLIDLNLKKGCVVQVVGEKFSYLVVE